MRTECKQARFEFHGLFQRKVKARFDGGKITSDAGVLLKREVERGTGLIAGLSGIDGGPDKKRRGFVEPGKPLLSEVPGRIKPWHANETAWCPLSKP